jgi:hypothetical protein
MTFIAPSAKAPSAVALSITDRRGPTSLFALLI